MATCNTAGACFAANDSPFPFQGRTTVRLLNVQSGSSVQMKLPASGANLSLAAGPKVSQWFCASAIRENPLKLSVKTGAAAPKGASAAAATPSTYTKVLNVLPLNRSGFTKQLSHATESDCEAACNSMAAACEGFTYFSWHGLNCALYPAARPALLLPPPLLPSLVVLARPLPQLLGARKHGVNRLVRASSIRCALLT